MFEAIVSGLVVAAFGGLTLLAYRHHAGYMLLSRPLKLGAWGVLISANAFSMGFTLGKLSDGKPEPFSSGWVTAGVIAFFVFIGLLDVLPQLINADESVKSETGGPSKTEG